MIDGSTPMVLIPRIRAIGCKLLALTPAREAMRSAAAPSLIPEELPAVTLPFDETIAGRPLNCSTDVVLGCSSRETDICTSFFLLYQHRYDFAVEGTGDLGLERFGLASIREQILIFPGDLKAFSNLFRRLRH